MPNLGPLYAVEYVREDDDREVPVLYRHVFHECEPIETEPGPRPTLAFGGDGSHLRVRGGEYTVDPEVGIVDLVEVMENPRKKKGGSKKRSRSRKSTTYRRPRSVTVRNPKKKLPAKRRKSRKGMVKMDAKTILTPVFGGVAAVILVQLATKLIAKATMQGKAVPSVLTNNVVLAPALLGLVLLSQAKKVGIKNIGLSMVVVSAALWFQRWASKSPAMAGLMGSDANLQGLGAIAPVVTPQYAARALGLTSARPRLSLPGAMMSGQPLGALEWTDNPPTDPSADPMLGAGARGTFGSLEPGDLPSWNDRGGWGAIESYKLPDMTDPFAHQFEEVPAP